METMGNLSAARKLSAGESFYGLLDRVCSTNFTVVARLSSMPGEKILREGLAAVQDRHPLLNVRISNETGGAVFRTDGVGAIPLRSADVPEDAWVAHAEHEINEAFDPVAGPLIRCAWLRHPGGRSTVMLTFHHAAGDGISAGYLIRDLLHFITGPDRSAGPGTTSLPEPLDRRFAHRFRGVRGFARYLGEISRAGTEAVRYGGLSAVAADARAPYRARRARAIPTIFDVPFTADLTAQARAEGTTVHGALAAAVLLGGRAEIFAEGPLLMALGSPVDMRGRVDPPVGDVVGMYASVVGTLSRVRREARFWELAREVKGAIEAGFARGMQFSFEPMTFRILGPFARLAGWSEVGAAAFTRLAAMLFPSTGFGLTNIGRLGVEERYGTLSVSWVVLIPSWSVFAHSGWSASTAAGRLSFTLVYMEPLLTRRHAETLSERTVGLLRSAV
jgi:hypothetical protein